MLTDQFCFLLKFRKRLRYKSIIFPNIFLKEKIFEKPDILFLSNILV